eukprot:Skav220401  [mRNA]  locus=scaffold639:382839:383905:- [translate_table: standard]
MEDGLTGSAWGDWANYTASPLRAFENELGAQVPLAGWIQIFGYAAYCEISAGYDADITKRTPGDMGWNPPIFSGNDPETKTRRLNAELANGRLAMMAIIGMFFQADSFSFKSNKQALRIDQKAFHYISA